MRVSSSDQAAGNGMCSLTRARLPAVLNLRRNPGRQVDARARLAVASCALAPRLRNTQLETRASEHLRAMRPCNGPATMLVLLLRAQICDVRPLLGAC